MGLRDVFGRRRGASDSAARPDDAPVFRHQADPATGELRRVPADVTSDPVPPPDPAPSVAAPVPAAGTPATPRSAAPAPSRTASPAPAAAVVPSPVPASTPTPAPAETPAPARPTPPTAAGGLVVGRAELRRPDVDLPTSYSSSPRPYDRTAVKRAWDMVSDRADTLVRTFYADLFLRLGDEALEMFPSSMAAQRLDFGKALVQWVVADDPETLAAHLAQLGADHRKFDVRPHHYDVAAQSLLSAWSRLLGDRWTPEIERAVVGSYTRLASTMIDGAIAAGDAAAARGATVVAHQRVHRDFAVLRLQPDEPYLFKAGQYLTLELASRRREWRAMSIASAPRPDNTLDLHVRSVNATGVAASLVMHTDVGDRVRLGTPRGNNLVVEPGTLGPGGLLCVASGTGAAPMLAVVESLLHWPELPPVYVFLGARTAADLYPVEHLTALVDRAGRADQVQVHGVVARDPGYTGLRGKIEDVVPTWKDWGQLGVDVLIAGPDAVVQTTIFGLVGRGVAERRIHFDQYDTSD